MRAVGVDVGGTKVAAALVDAGGTLHDQVRVDSPAEDGEAMAAAIAGVISTLCAGADAGSVVGVAAAGNVDLYGVMRYAPNIAWRDFPLRERLEAATGRAVRVENDANAAAWAEYRLGAAREASSMVMLTLGTGVGGGVVLEGGLVRGWQGLGGELGHLVLSEGGPPCACGNHGDLESLASGTAIARAAQEAIDAGAAPASSPLAGLAAVDGEDVTAAALAGDAFARGILSRTGFWLGRGIGSLVNALDPEIVVVGGGAMAAGELLLDAARASAEETLTGRGHRTMPAVVPAALGNAAGIVGAALLAGGDAP